MADEITFDVRGFSLALESASQHLLDEIQALAVTEASNLAAAVRSAYPHGKTGNLRAGVVWGPSLPRGGLGAWVRSNAPHVHLVEQGRPGPGRGRQWPTPAVRGKSVYFIPIAMRARAHFLDRVQTLLNRDRQIG